MSARRKSARVALGSPRAFLAQRPSTLAAIALTALAGAAPMQAAESSAPHAACADERSCVDRLLELENERLALMPAVAAWKWRHHAAITDPERERAVIADSAKLAEPLGLAGAPIERLFALQIRLASDVETAFERKWRERGFDASQPDLDLARDLRPRIDRLTQELLSTLAIAAPALSRADFEALYAADADRQLQAVGWTPATRRELLGALGEIRRLPVPRAAHSTRLILLGTNGGPVVNQFRSEPASLLIVDGGAYLIDAGSGTLRQLALANMRPEQLRTIFITHHHIDHDAGLPSLLAAIWFANAWGHLDTAPMHIYGPPSTRYLVHAALDYLSVSERIFRAGVPALAPSAPMFETRDIDHDGLIVDDGTVRVTAAENTHFHFKSASAAGADKSYAYRFETPAGTVVFTGDTGPSDAVTHLANGADILVSEVCAACSVDSVPVGARGDRPPLPAELGAEERFHMLHEHLTPGEVGDMAARAHVKVLVLTHLGPYPPGADMTILTSGIAKHFSGTVIPGRDFLEYDLNAPGASRP